MASGSHHKVWGLFKVVKGWPREWTKGLHRAMDLRALGIWARRGRCLMQGFVFLDLAVTCSAFLSSGVWKKRWGALMVPLYLPPHSPCGWKCSATMWPRQCVLIPTRGRTGRCRPLSMGPDPGKVSLLGRSPQLLSPQRASSSSKRTPALLRPAPYPPSIFLSSCLPYCTPSTPGERRAASRYTNTCCPDGVEGEEKVLPV